MLKRLAAAGVLATFILVACGGAGRAGQPAADGSPGSSQSTSSLPKKLSVGDPAPPLTIHTWVKGEPVPELKKGRVYVVEFWATWCGPCRISIPHLTELQKKHRAAGLTIVGISSSERKGLEDVRPFVEKMGTQMDYTVAWDLLGNTSQAWMAAAGQTGIPAAFVVNQEGRVAWIGHPVYPQGSLDSVLVRVLSGRYNLDEEIVRAKRIQETQTRLQVAAASSDTAGVLAGLDTLMVLDTIRFNDYALQKLQVLFTVRRYDAAYAYAARLVDGPLKDDPDILSGIAAFVATNPGLEKRDLNLALRAATRASELTGGTNAIVLDTLGRVHFSRGDAKLAAEVEAKAVSLADDVKAKADMQARLDQYRQAAARK